MGSVGVISRFRLGISISPCMGGRVGTAMEASSLLLAFMVEAAGLPAEC